MDNKLLYIGDNPAKSTNGGEWINQRNILALKNLYHNNLHIFPIVCKNSLITFLNLLFNYMIGSSPFVTFRIIQYIKRNNINYVFLASSKLGKLALLIKRNFPEIKIYIFFHNIEKQYTEEEVKVNPTWKNHFIAKVTAYNERLSCQYADKLILLNQRDNLLLKEIYNKEASILLPTTFIDKFNPKLKKEKKSINKDFILLFVGYAFFANIEGLKWFIKNVLPELENCKLQIIGNGMNKIFTSTENIEVHGYIEDLSQYYYQCDAVILPIFSGSGMKTKTAEALMYGCPIIGTKEAFEGYNLDFDLIGGLANSKTEMINSINRLKNNISIKEEAQKYARNIFNQFFNFDKTIAALREILQ